MKNPKINALFAAAAVATSMASTAPDALAQSMSFCNQLVDLGSATERKTVTLPFYAESRVVSRPADLLGMTKIAHQPFWAFTEGGNWYSGGALDGGNIYRDTYFGASGQTIVKVGSSGFRSVSALAFLRSMSWTWWSGWGWGWTWHGFWRPQYTYRLIGAASSGTGPSDRLISINLATGAGTEIGVFGTHAGRTVQDIEGLAIHPTTGVLYGITGDGFDGTPGDIFRIDIRTGTATYLGSIVNSLSSRPPDAETTGLAFDNYGNLFASLGNGASTWVGATIRINVPRMTFEPWAWAKDGLPRNDLSPVTTVY